MRRPPLATCRLIVVLVAGGSFLTSLGAEPDATRSRIAMFEPAAQKEDATLAAALATMADSVELSLNVMQRYDVSRLPAVDPARDLEKVRAYCQKNRIDQAILGSGSARPEGGYSLRLLVFDRRKNSITTDQKRASKGALDLFDVTDSLVASLLDGLSGRHVLFGSLAVESDPPGAAVSVNGKNVGKAPLSLRGLPVGTVELTAGAEGREGAKATVTISDGETTHASLMLPRTVGTLAIVMPKDAVATIRSTEIGQKDVTGPGLQVLPTGEYDVVARSPGLPAASGRVAIGRGATAQWLPWSKVYLDVRSEPAGASIVVDGESMGVAPQVVEVEPGALHTVELAKQDYETFRADLTQDAGSKILISRKLKPTVSTPAPPAAVVAPAAVAPAAPQGPPLPQASIKIDGKFEDWQNVASVAVGSPGATGNMEIDGVSMAVDSANLYIKIDIADKSPSSFFHPYNFNELHESPSYGITIDNGEGPRNLSVRLFHYEPYGRGWEIDVGTRRIDTFQTSDNGYRYSMKGSSVEVALPLAKIKGLLGDLGPTGRFRVVGWTAHGGVPTSETGARAERNFTNALDDIRQTKAGYFGF